MCRRSGAHRAVIPARGFASAPSAHRVWSSNCWRGSKSRSSAAACLHALNGNVYKAFNAAGIEIPYSKQDVYVKEMPRKTGIEMRSIRFSMTAVAGAAGAGSGVRLRRDHRVGCRDESK